MAQVPPHPQIALASSGLSRIRRGYETFMLDLFGALRAEGNFALLKGSGAPETKGVIRIPTLSRTNAALKLLYPRNEAGRYRQEQFSMALGGWLTGQWQRYELIHFCDPSLGSALYRLRERFGYRYKLVFHHGGMFRPQDYARFDHIQQLTPPYLQEGVDYGLPDSQCSLVPLGIDPSRFHRRLDAQEKAGLRHPLKIPPDALVILSVASLDDDCKRLEVVIDAVAALERPDVFLLLVGQNTGSPYANQILSRAKARLPGQFYQMSVPYEQIADVYALSDLFVLASLREGFGKAYLEAMAGGLPIITHDNPHTRWIVPADACRADLSESASLTRALAGLIETDRPTINPLARQAAEHNYQHLLSTFHWDVVAPQYRAMYRRILGLSPEGKTDG